MNPLNPNWTLVGWVAVIVLTVFALAQLPGLFG